MALPRENYPFVDVLRGFAAILVLVFHAMHVGGRDEFPDADIWHFFDYGWVGVNLFLVISGFVITLSGFRHLEEYPHAFSRAFTVSRMARIVPLYLLTGVVFVLATNPSWLRDSLPAQLIHITSHLAFVHNLYPVTHGSIDGPNWSIALEVQFYLFFMLIAPWLLRRAGLVHLVAALLLGTLFRLLTSSAIGPGQQTLQFIYATQLPGVIGHFALGAGVAFAVQPSKKFELPCPVPGWHSFAAWSTLSIVGLGISAALLQRFGYWDNMLMVTFLPAILSFGFMAALVAAITFPPGARRGLRALSLPGRDQLWPVSLAHARRCSCSTASTLGWRESLPGRRLAP
jgi:peptidoglycan/LPS O-acetylase OafA/YrhL